MSENSVEMMLLSRLKNTIKNLKSLRVQVKILIFAKCIIYNL